MILLYAFIFNIVEAVFEAYAKVFMPKTHEFIEKYHSIVVILVFGGWFIPAVSFDAYYVPLWKIFLGFWFIRFFIYDLSWNITSIILGSKISLWYYGTVKVYDRTMAKLGSFGWFMKMVLGIVGICFLMGWS